MSRLDVAQRQLRRSIFVMVLAALAVATRAFAFASDAPTPTPGGWGFEQLVTLPNLLSLSVLIFHLGVVRQQIADIREHLKELPDIYARRDVMKSELAKLSSDLRARGIR